MTPQQSKRESNTSEAGAARPAGARERLGGRGKEFRLNSKSSGKSLIRRVENRLERDKSSSQRTH